MSPIHAVLIIGYVAIVASIVARRLPVTNYRFTIAQALLCMCGIAVVLAIVRVAGIAVLVQLVFVAVVALILRRRLLFESLFEIICLFFVTGAIVTAFTEPIMRAG